MTIKIKYNITIKNGALPDDACYKWELYRSYQGTNDFQSYT